MMSGDPSLPVLSAGTENGRGCLCTVWHQSFARQRGAWSWSSSSLDTSLVQAGSQLWEGRGLSLQLWQGGVKALVLPSLPSSTHPVPSVTALLRQQVLLETISEPQMTRRIRQLTFAGRLE